MSDEVAMNMCDYCCVDEGYEKPQISKDCEFCGGTFCKIHIDELDHKCEHREQLMMIIIKNGDAS